MSKKNTPLTMDDVEVVLKRIITKGRKHVGVNPKTGELNVDYADPGAADLKTAMQFIQMAADSGRHDIAGRVQDAMAAKGLTLAPVADAG